MEEIRKKLKHEILSYLHRAHEEKLKPVMSNTNMAVVSTGACLDLGVVPKTLKRHSEPNLSFVPL